MAHYTLTVYREDDTTPWFEVGTDPAHPNPYLHEPGESDHGEVDFLRGTATIGQVNLRVIDPQTGASQSERWLTERLGIPANEAGAGHTALIGRRALLLRDTTTIIDGVVYSVALAETFAGFVLSLRDIRERARKTKLFERTGTATMLPRGVLNGYGRLPDGRFLVPPTAPLAALFVVEPGMARFDLSQHWFGTPIYDPNATVPPWLVFDEHMAAATVVDVTGRYANVRLLWRVAGTATWNVLDSPLGVRGVHLLNTWRARLRDAGLRNGEMVQGIIDIVVDPSQAPLPNDQEHVDVLLVYTGPATQHYPFHFEGTAGELLAAIYDGQFSAQPPGIRYDSAAVLALTTPVRLRITEPVDDARDWTERFIYRAVGAVPALDSQGRISPVRAAFPDPDAILPELTDENAQPVPGWEHSGQRAVTVVRVTYQRDYRVSANSAQPGERSGGDGIASRSVTVEHRAPDWAIGLMGEQPHDIDGVIFRALGGVDGEPITGDVTDETGAQVAAQRAIETLDRWLFGGQISTCRILAAAFPGLRVGDWVIDSRSWRPNYATGQRGGPRLAQVMSVRELNPAWLEVMLIDGGPAAVPLGQPTLGTLTVDSAGVVSVPVTAVPTGGEAAVYYAVSSSEPPADSPLWTFLGRTASPAILRTPSLPSGTTVWVRARGEAAGRRPSTYTTPVSIVTPATPRVHGVRVDVAHGVVTVAWTPNAQTLGVRVFYAAHAPDVEPTLIDSLDVAAAGGSVVLPLRIEIGQSVTVEVEPWTGWTGSAVSGTAGSRVRAAATYDPERRDPRATIRIVSTTRTSETLEYQGRPGPLGRGPLEYRRRIDEMGAEGPWGPGPGDGWASLPTSPFPQQTIQRAKFWPRTVVLQVRDADLQVAEARHTIAPELPALDDQTGEVRPGTIRDEHYSSSPFDKLSTVKVRFPPTVEIVANEAAGQVQRDITVTIRDPDNGQVRLWWRVVTTPSDSYTTPAPTNSGALQTQPYTVTVRVDRAAVDSFVEFWGEDEDGNRSAIMRVPIPPLENPGSLMDPLTIMTTLGNTCPSELVDILTWTLAVGLPAGWRVEVWIIEGTTLGDPFSGTRLSSNASSPFQTTRLQNVRSSVGSQYQRTYGLRLVNSHGIVVDEETNGRADGYEPCPT